MDQELGVGVALDDWFDWMIELGMPMPNGNIEWWIEDNWLRFPEILNDLNGGQYFDWDEGYEWIVPYTSESAQRQRANELVVD